MNNMIFSFVQKPYSGKHANISDNKEIQRNTDEPLPVNTLPIRKKKPTSVPSNNMSFSSIASLNGSMFQRIQYATSGCGACGK